MTRDDKDGKVIKNEVLKKALGKEKQGETESLVTEQQQHHRQKMQLALQQFMVNRPASHTLKHNLQHRGHHLGLIVTLLLFAFSAPMAQAQFAVICATVDGPCASEITTLATKIETVLHTAKFVSMLADMAIQAKRQGGLSPSNVNYDLAAIDALLRQSGALTQAQPGIQRWDAVFPPVQQVGTGRYYSDYQQWSRNTSDTLRAVQLAGQLSHSQGMGVAAQIQLLEQFVGLVTGRLQAGMMAAATSARTAASVQQLHETTMTSAAAQATFNQYLMQKDMTTQAMEQQYFAPTTVPRDNVGW